MTNITTEEYNEIPDSVLLMIAKKARNNMERDEITDLLDEVVLRYARSLGSGGCRTASEATKEFIENTSMSDIIATEASAEDDVIPPFEEEDESWIPWNGGECPVPTETLVDVLLRNGTQINRNVWDSDISWMHHDSVIDTVFYRVCKE